METATLEKPVTETPVQEELTEDLNTTDRCDCSDCGAQAWVVVTLNNGILKFCGHDFAKHEKKLREGALNIKDERHRLTYNRHKGSENS